MDAASNRRGIPGVRAGQAEVSIAQMRLVLFVRLVGQLVLLLLQLC